MRTAAILTIHKAGKMTKKGRKDVVAWMRRNASHFLKHGQMYSETRFTARYIYR